MVKEFKQAWTENKIVLSILGLVLTGLLAWGVWVTQRGYVTTFNVEKITNISNDIVEIKKDVSGVKSKMDIQAGKMDLQIQKSETNQAEILKNQAEIIRELRRK